MEHRGKLLLACGVSPVPSAQSTQVLQAPVTVPVGLCNASCAPAVQCSASDARSDLLPAAQSIAGAELELQANMPAATGRLPQQRPDETAWGGEVIIGGNL